MKKFLLLFMAAVLLTGCVRYSGGEPVEKKEEKEVVKKEEPKKELTLDEQIKEIVVDKIGKTNNMKKDRIVELSVDSDIAYLKLNASENLSNNMTKKKMWMDSISILEPISKIESVKGVIIHWMFPLVDQYGNSEDVNVMAFNIEREELDKINWDNFLIENLPTVVNDYFEHQALSK
ncbi:hypothetical protein KHA94_16165 [Bacillus sp. FJAT-49705]|uniref:Lipoprotein n=1 Tax=Cytobacillus citreus TaxID=2833586 RepID=A0ABS5NV72_9BACI|nr:hypothetical protein [Cytobacillus citreus]MBS4191725.1 hypothetical protein [Cytobacillus citreus]